MKARCKHHWVHIDAYQHFDASGYGDFTRRDLYHCDKCLELRVQEQRFYRESGIDYRVPEWYTGPTPSRR